MRKGTKIFPRTAKPIYTLLLLLAAPPSVPYVRHNGIIPASLMRIRYSFVATEASPPMTSQAGPLGQGGCVPAGQHVRGGSPVRPIRPNDRRENIPEGSIYLTPVSNFAR